MKGNLRNAFRTLALFVVFAAGAACASAAPKPSPSPAPSSAPTAKTTSPESAATIERLAATLTVLHAEADGAAICPKVTRGFDETTKQIFPMAVAARVRAGLDAIPRPELRAFFTEARVRGCTALCRCGTYADFAGAADPALEAVKNRFLDEEKAHPRDERAIAACARADARRVCGSEIYRSAAVEARKARSGEAK